MYIFFNMIYGIIFRLLFCGYVMWCRNNYQRSFCIPSHDELYLNEDENLSTLHHLKSTNAHFYHLHNPGEYNITEPYLNLVAY